MSNEAANTDVPSVAQEAVMVPGTSGDLPVDPVIVKGYDFNKGVDHSALLDSFLTSGFQATNFGLAVEEINKMVCTCKKRIEVYECKNKEYVIAYY